MASGQLQHAIGIFRDRQIALQALDELRSSGFPMNEISVITKTPKLNEQLDSSDTSESTLTPAEGAKAGGLAGARAGGLLTLVAGFGILLIPGFGPALAAESVLATLLGSGASAAAGGLIGALRGWFLPEEAAKLYNDRVFQGNYLVTIESTEDNIHQAEPILKRFGIQEWRIFDIPRS
ncbi:hypothetical protein GNF10_09350 [Nostoc sp. UCD121]|uniref:general stress protein n=1 Tax=unclassified Nostoc TaxID=2593658 RepID=UPI001629458F|nr:MULTISPECIES: general stress protein [unclassified Nostoc]MBC1218608.1 hypothetical protein [Nostoc sp. UCD120]MBC1276191.1 hypothetical protein [Nostoc sp. UCD121]MBC1296295.1 hypothetical protein [Nostoc sp. UCD122]